MKASTGPGDNTTDFTDLLSAARHGEEWAWHRLHQDLAGPVTGYLRSRGAAEPEDLASEVFLQMARNMDRFDGDEDSFRSWVFVIAHRRLIDARRAAGRRPVTTADAIEVLGGNVEDEALDRESLSRVDQVMSHLTDDQRDVLALRVVADLSLAQTAEVMGKEIGAVKALQRRAIASLRRLFEEGRVSL